MVVSLIEEQEFGELMVPELPTQAQMMGMAWRHLPIRDRYPPGDTFRQRWPTIGNEIIATLTTAGRVYIHCKGGRAYRGCRSMPAD
jgi:protein-tyrosine phosphatase